MHCAEAENEKKQQQRQTKGGGGGGGGDKSSDNKRLCAGIQKFYEIECGAFLVCVFAAAAA